MKAKKRTESLLKDVLIIQYIGNSATIRHIIKYTLPSNAVLFFAFI